MISSLYSTIMAVDRNVLRDLTVMQRKQNEFLTSWINLSEIMFLCATINLATYQ